MQEIITLPKENIGQLKFSREDVLVNTEDLSLRRYAVERALSLGNLYHQKVTIIYIENRRSAAIANYSMGSRR